MELTTEYLKEILDYNSENGVFSWKKSPNRSIKVGDVAGCLHHTGYIQIKIDGKKYQSHRLAFLYITGVFPVNHVDHINGVRNDNSWDNLRLATNQENARNRGANSNNKLGLKGVRKNKYGTYDARINLDKKKYCLGTYSTKAEASVVYELYAEEFFGEFYHD